jgi:hypothetical protein
MLNARDDTQIPAGIVLIGWERLLLAGALLAGFLAILAVSGTALLVRVAGANPGSASPFVAAGAIVVSLALVPWTRTGRGPISAIARRLPPGLDGGLRRQPVAAGLAALLALIAVFQVARLSCFMADPALRWGSAFPPVEFGVRHMCMSSYVHAADLMRRGVPNVYAEEHYPAYGSGQPGDANPVSSSVANLAPHVRDAFEYPPPFLLLPRAALVLTNDFLVMRTGWFMLQATLFCAFALFLASWVGGSRGTLAGLLLPGILSSFPLLFNLQFGQFHLVVVLLAMGGMLAFQVGRDRLGGALLAGAIVTKIFPGLLLIYLALRRRNRPILWTLAFAAAYTLAGLLVLGSAPYRAFFEYQLPRLASGEAFHVLQSSDLILAANASVYSIPFKLQRLGVLGMPATLATVLTWLYTALLVGAVVIVARRHRDSTLEPVVWLGILTLASLRSPVAPNVYVSTSALWLLTLLAVETRGRAVAVALLVVAWVCISVQPPLPDPKATIALWMSGQIAMLVLGFGVLLRRTTGAVEPERQPC